MSEIKTYKKLIEVVLPLDDINIASQNEKQPFTRNHPRSFHIWWARRPFVTARAILFSQLVNDPYEVAKGDKRTKAVKELIELERERLFGIIRDLVKWENTSNEEVLNKAREEIKKSWIETCELNKNHPEAKELFDPEKLPAFHDPFAGGGALPLEAQRLGLESYASDLNPVPVMINKAMIEIPSMFINHIPIGPIPVNEKKNPKLHEDWSGIKGLAEEVRRYGIWMHNKAKDKLNYLYPSIKITEEIVKEQPNLNQYLNKELNPIAYIWTRTVRSPNPAYNNVYVPLVRSFDLSTKKGKEVWIEPIISENSYDFVIRNGKRPEENISGTVCRTGGICLLSNTPMPFKYIREEGQKNRLDQKLMAIVCEGKRERVYLSPKYFNDKILDNINPDWIPNLEIPDNSRDFKTSNYGMNTFGSLFSKRQLVILNTLSELLKEVEQDIMKFNNKELANAVLTYLSISISRWTDLSNALASWNSKNQNIRALFARQAIPMNWDYAELSPFSNVGPWLSSVDSIVNAFQNLAPFAKGYSLQADAQKQSISNKKVISTDPPYYDNIGYADLSDFFYIWLRKNLKTIYPSLFSTISSPKQEELVATPYRHGNKENAEKFFLDGMTDAMKSLAIQSHDAFPITIYYAFKQSDTKEKGTASTGWETFLAAVINSGLLITGTWPVRTEREARAIGIGSNALASSIVLVCRKRSEEAETISRREFQKELKDEMPDALEAMIGGKDGASPIAPVDLAQAAIGPGMGIYSKYKEVLNQDGSVMSVHDALIMINKAVDEYFGDAEGELDEDTRFAIDWFMQYGFSNGTFGEADTLSRAKGTSVDLVKDAGIIESGQGKVKLLKWEEYPINWDPTKDNRTPVWEATHHMIRVLNQKGENDAGYLLSKMPQRTESIRQLAYRLYTLCERKGRAEEARAYNELIGSWHSIVEASYASGARMKEQGTLDLY